MVSDLKERPREMYNVCKSILSMEEGKREGTCYTHIHVYVCNVYYTIH